MTPLKIERHQNLGIDALYNVEELSIAIFFYGVFVVLFSASVVIFVRRRFSNRWAAAMFVVTVINFLLFGLSAGNEIAKFAMFIRKDLIEDPLLKKQESENALQNLMIVQFWSANLPMLFSDLIIIWRAWVLFQLENRQWVIFIPFVLWIGAVGLTVGNLIWISIPYDHESYKSHTWYTINNSGRALSIATNAVTTMMIAYKLWSYRKFILGSSRRQNPVQALLSFSVESGLVFLGIQIVCLLINVYSGTGVALQFEQYGFGSLYFSLSAMYPTIVYIVPSIVPAETRRSTTDIYEIELSNASRHAGPVVSDHDARAATSGHPSFVVGPIDSAMDNETESPPSRALQTEDVRERGLKKIILEVKER